MKKIFLTLLMAGSLFASCDMDKAPYGSLDDKTAIQSVSDCLRYRNGLYNNMRALTTGAYVYYPDIQVDIFQGVITNGNRVGLFSTGNILSSDTDIATMWAANYSTIQSANFILGEMAKLREKGSLSDSELAVLSRYEGEAYFVRAYCYYWLMDHFCESYSADNANTEATGLPLVTEYNPTADNNTYPGRSTLAQTYLRIEEDLTLAYNALLDYEKKDKSAVTAASPYLSSYAVQALQARVALLKGDNPTALKKAEAIINSGLFPLVGIDKYEAMWTNDTGSEIIFQPFMSNTELGSSTGSAYLSQNQDQADYIPESNVLAMYDATNDIRYKTFFDTWTLNVDGNKVKAPVFTKYPGNPNLIVGGLPNYMNMPKVFRASELYLIAAEAAASTNETTANKYLDELRKKRITGYQSTTYTGKTLLDEIRTERFKELVGEGYRLSDLRRWGFDFQRDPTYPNHSGVEDIIVAAGSSLAYIVGDYRYVWPIPSSEIDSNPQLKGQQNKGY